MKKILIVDDSSFMRNILKDILSDKSYFHEELALYEADGKENALKQFEKISPNIILLDIVMQESETEGVEFLRSIKGLFDINKIVIISSVGQKSVLQECDQIGVKHFLQKPFDQVEVLEVVKRLL